MYFDENVQIGRDEFIRDAIHLVFTSDIDPDWFPDTVMRRDNFTTLRIGLTIVGLVLAVRSLVVVTKKEGA